MAGTRLAAHVCFLLFSLISVLVAWRLGVVKRAPLPLKTMANPLVSSAASSPGGRPPTLPVDIDVVLLRNPNDNECPSCAAALDAMQANPALARNAFRDAEESAEAAGDRQYPHELTRNAARQPNSSSSSSDNNVPPLFAIREVNLRVVHADHGLAAAELAPRASTDPAALDDWLHRFFILTPQPAAEGTATDRPSPAATRDSNPSSPRYTFFVGCSGGGDAGHLPTFIMGRHRHGYLGLGCACACGDGGGGGNGSGKVTADPTRGGDTGSVASGPGLAASVAALAVLQALAGIIAGHVLRSPVPAGDVHVRLGQAYRLNFALLSEDPARRRCTWDFAGASRRYLRPMLRKLHPVAGFAVQVRCIA